jgi:hypothetical protein
MPDITVNEATHCGSNGALGRRGSLKNQRELLLRKKSFFAFALNIGFFLCYFRRRVEFVGNGCPRSQTF